MAMFAATFTSIALRVRLATGQSAADGLLDMWTQTWFHAATSDERDTAFARAETGRWRCGGARDEDAADRVRK